MEASTGVLHEQRLDAVVRRLLVRRACRVLDLGCGRGDLLRRLAPYAQFSRIVGIDIDQHAIEDARLALGLGIPDHRDRIQVRYGSFEIHEPELRGFDAAALVETIEHVDPRRLSRVEAAVFAGMRPRVVLITTPNQEYNVVHGMLPGQLRHPDHRFEWNRGRFRQWANGVASRCGYHVDFEDIGVRDPVYGSSTQMAVFSLLAARQSLPGAVAAQETGAGD